MGQKETVEKAAENKRQREEASKQSQQNHLSIMRQREARRQEDALKREEFQRKQEAQYSAPAPSYSQSSRPSEKSVWDALGRKAPHGGGYEDIDTKADENSSPISLFNEGEKCRRNRIRKPEQMLHWYTLSAEKGEKMAQCMLGRWLFHGDNEKALYWLNKSAQQGDSDAKYELAIYYVLGKIVERNLDKAYKLLQESCEYTYYGYNSEKCKKKSLKLLIKLIKAERKQTNPNAKFKAEIFQSQLIIEHNQLYSEMFL